MSVQQLDHINILTACIADSIKFYGEILGMTIKPPPFGDDLSLGAFAYDEAGRAIVHLMATDQVVAVPEPIRGVAQRGLIDHFALRVRDPERFIARLRQHGIDYSERDVPEVNLHQIVVRDPNGVLVELNFPL